MNNPQNKIRNNFKIKVKSKWWLFVNRRNCEGQSEAINNNRKRRGSYKMGRHCGMMRSIDQCLMLTGLIILIREDLKDEQGQNGSEEEFNEGVQGQMKSAQHWSER